jgi:hypothetical protein
MSIALYDTTDYADQREVLLANAGDLRNQIDTLEDELAKSQREVKKLQDKFVKAHPLTLTVSLDKTHRGYNPNRHRVYDYGVNEAVSALDAAWDAHKVEMSETYKNYPHFLDNAGDGVHSFMYWFVKWSGFVRIE